jgi:hypothetical protein
VEEQDDPLKVELRILPTPVHNLWKINKKNNKAEGAVEGQDNPFGVELRILPARVHNHRKNKSKS